MILNNGATPFHNGIYLDMGAIICYSVIGGKVSQKWSKWPQQERFRKMTTQKVQETTGADDFVMVSDGQVTPETKIVFEVIGDSFTGMYLGMRSMNNPDGNYQQARFEKDGEIFFVNANHSLKDGLKTVRNGAKTRITYANDLDTGQALPMRIYTVEVSRSSRVTMRPAS